MLESSLQLWPRGGDGCSCWLGRGGGDGSGDATLETATRTARALVVLYGSCRAADATISSGVVVVQVCCRCDGAESGVD